MKKGFKAHAERKAIEIRDDHGVGLYEPLHARKLAKHLKYPVKTPDQISQTPQELLHILLNADPESWSAFTIAVPSKRPVIFHNPSHSPHRQESNILHEISHLLCSHQTDEILRIDGIQFPLRTCNKTQEEEADWLAGCIKIPRDTLLWARRKKMSEGQISEMFNVSVALVTYRLNKTGVNAQLSRFASKRNWSKK